MRFKSILPVAVVVMVALVVASAAQQPAAPAQPAQRWEYGVLSSHGADGWTWSDAGRHFVGDTAQMFQAFGGKGKKTLTADVVNRLGVEGWELVAVAPGDGEVTTAQFWFKRPAR